METRGRLPNNDIVYNQVIVSGFIAKGAKRYEYIHKKTGEVRAYWKFFLKVDKDKSLYFTAFNQAAQMFDAGEVGDGILVRCIGNLNLWVKKKFDDQGNEMKFGETIVNFTAYRFELPKIKSTRQVYEYTNSVDGADQIENPKPFDDGTIDEIPF